MKILLRTLNTGKCNIYWDICRGILNVAAAVAIKKKLVNNQKIVYVTSRNTKVKKIRPPNL